MNEVIAKEYQEKLLEDFPMFSKVWFQYYGKDKIRLCLIFFHANDYVIVCENTTANISYPALKDMVHANLMAKTYYDYKTAYE